jgi:hypothetical protein
MQKCHVLLRYSYFLSSCVHRRPLKSKYQTGVKAWVHARSTGFRRLNLQSSASLAGTLMEAACTCKLVRMVEGSYNALLERAVFAKAVHVTDSLHIKRDGGHRAAVFVWGERAVRMSAIGAKRTLGCLSA